MKNIRHYKSLFLTAFINPISMDEDLQRREMVLNTVLCTLFIFSVLALLLPIINLASDHSPHNYSSIISSLIFSVAIFGLIKLSRKGHSTISAFILVALMALAVTELTALWSFELPIAELMYALTIVTTSVLLKTRAALLVSVMISLTVFVISFLQTQHILIARTDWADQPFTIGDAVAYLVIFGMIAVIAWLGNREIDRAFVLARISKRSILKQRDQLEVIVQKRTEQLKAEQEARTLDLQRFAEFGRISAGLIHDVANPLTTISLNLDLMQNYQQNDLVTKARESLKYLERYLDGMRKQIHLDGQISEFSINAEILQVLDILGHRSSKAQVTLKSQVDQNIKMRGDAVKFSRIIANLLSNSIDACSDQDPQSKKYKVKITAERSYDTVTLRVTDNGPGIDESYQEQIFDAFYTTKSKTGMGMGLSLVKEYAEKDFGGSISVQSKPGRTTFTVILHDA